MEKFLTLLQENINMSDLANAANITWKGMAAVFIVMAVISLIVLVAAKAPKIMAKVFKK